MFQLIKSCTGKWRGNDCPARARECWFVRSSESKIRSRFRPFRGEKCRQDVMASFKLQVSRYGFVFDGRAGAGRLLQPPKLWGGDKVMASGVSCFALFDVKLFRGKNKKDF